ncbi:ASCH domain-containing protein [Larkinella bovis]|uniref:ASCH domain-containing protein n=1 Tax=Larkinella bovis TaxID=683041 RepID=A0ABW0II11_9BACT
MKVLLSIKPEFVERIFSGQKRFEYRKALFKKDVTTVIVYSTMPIGLIVGEFKVKKIHKDEPTNLWEKTKEYSGVAEVFYNEYFKGRNQGFAIEIFDPLLYDEPINPKEKFASFTAPQSFAYLD